MLGPPKNRQTLPERVLLAPQRDAAEVCENSAASRAIVLHTPREPAGAQNGRKRQWEFKNDLNDLLLEGMV